MQTLEGAKGPSTFFVQKRAAVFTSVSLFAL